MIIIITIDTSNAAFEDKGGAEVARILEDLAGKYENGDYPLDEGNSVRLYDINGNRCGRLTHTEEHL